MLLTEPRLEPKEMTKAQEELNNLYYDLDIHIGSKKLLINRLEEVNNDIETIEAMIRELEEE